MKENRVGIAIDPSVRDKHQTDAYKSERVSRLVREALQSSGLGTSDGAACLKEIIPQGATVLLKPNWVIDHNVSGSGNECLVTHPAIVEAVLDEVVAAHPGRIVIADAPVQGCRFEEIVPLKWQEYLREIAGDIPLVITDLRRTIASGEGIDFSANRDLRPSDRYVLFDLGNESILEPVSKPAGRFRVTCYDPDLLARTHRPGCHQYLIARELFEADVVINLPKLKSHRKAGITAALKNLVGVNGDKDYLPHHRIGGAGDGGDCYPGKHPLKRLTEWCLDEANRNINKPLFGAWKFATRGLSFLSVLSGGDHELEGGWNGNDTVWRMALDLNRIAIYGRSDGTLAKRPQRPIYSLTDGIIAGEGNGPLAPTPLLFGAVTFAISSPFADLAHCALMHFNPQQIPLVRESFFAFAYPLANASPISAEFICNGQMYNFNQLATRWGISARPASGWVGYMEWHEMLHRTP